jgi:hypothetical protein
MLLPAALLLASLQQQAQDLTLPPEGVALYAIYEGRGVQIYTCAPNAGKLPAFQWVLQAPEAQLFNLATGKQVGHHDAGPTWTLEDGSAIKGTVLQKRSGDSPANVPWLLLQTMPASEKEGALSHVTFVRRSATAGGSAPGTGCDAQHLDQNLRVPYTASYAFYGDPQFSPERQAARVAQELHPSR